MMRIKTAAIWARFCGHFLLPASATMAQTAPSGVQIAQASPPAAAPATPRRSTVAAARANLSALRASRARCVYPRYYPGPNAVRDCTATYVEEYRPSGTVIVPRMNCFWRPG